MSAVDAIERSDFEELVVVVVRVHKSPESDVHSVQRWEIYREDVLNGENAGGGIKHVGVVIGAAADLAVDLQSIELRE